MKTNKAEQQLPKLGATVWVIHFSVDPSDAAKKSRAARGRPTPEGMIADVLARRFAGVDEYYEKRGELRFVLVLPEGGKTPSDVSEARRRGFGMSYRAANVFATEAAARALLIARINEKIARLEAVRALVIEEGGAK
jgi:hypothetical protein